MAESRRHLGAGAALSVLVQGSPLVAAAALSIVLARTIGPSGNGQFALLSTLTGLLGLVSSLGFSSGLIFEVSRQRWSARSALHTSYVLGFGLGLAGFVVGIGFFALTRESVYRGVSLPAALVALASVPLAVPGQYGIAILLARERYEGYALLALAYSGTVLVVGTGLAVWSGVSGAVVALPAAALVGTVLGVVLLRPAIARDTVVDRAGSLGRALRFSLQSWGANLLQQINYRFDVLILGALASAHDVGIYSVALTVTSTSWILPGALQTVLLPRVASLDEATFTGKVSAEESDASLARGVRHGVLLTLPAGLLITLLLLVGLPLLYGPEFHETIWLGFVLLPGTLMLGIGKVVGTAAVGRGYPRYILYSGLISVPVTLGLYLSLIPTFRAWGAAASSSISYGLTALIAVFFFRRVTLLGFRETFVPRAEDLADYRNVLRLALARRQRQ